jgi:hypothetical protein
VVAGNVMKDAIVFGLTVVRKSPKLNILCGPPNLSRETMTTLLVRGLFKNYLWHCYIAWSKFSSVCPDITLDHHQKYAGPSRVRMQLGARSVCN